MSTTATTPTATSTASSPRTEVGATAQPRTLAPNELPFTTSPLAFRTYVTDTGKILPRKYTHLPAKQQRAVTKAIKHARNNLLAL